MDLGRRVDTPGGGGGPALRRAPDRLLTTAGATFTHQQTLGVLEIGMRLGFRYNHDDESLDVQPGDQIPRSEVAWSLYQASLVKTSEVWKVAALRSEGFRNIHL